MIGWYVHHQGQGHRQRAEALASELSRLTGHEVTGLSTLSRPEQWDGPWVDLPDDATDAPVAPTPGDQLHWVPVGGEGLLARTAAISTWIARARPAAVVVDVSVEVCLLARLHGVPVVSFVLPGHRDDTPHLTGLRTADALVSAWPPEVDPLSGVPDDVHARVVPLGGVSRFDGTPPTPADDLPWTVLGGGAWTGRDGVRDALAGASVAVTFAGQGSIADLAALQVPAVVVAADRPFGEQAATVTSLQAGPWPVVPATVEDALSRDLLLRASALDRTRWAGWCGRGAARRLAEVVADVAIGTRPTVVPA
jgi:hypothetical protein